MSRTLSFVVPSGSLTLGNLLGAIRQWVTDQRGDDSLFGVADLHALTLSHDPAGVRTGTREQALILLAAGLDPARCVFFVQSHVPAHTQLHWLLEATAYDGELRRMIQYKQKAAAQNSVRSALLAYPVLMAADILLYQVETVPVGHDQTQHLELARELAERFNGAYGQTFTLPRPVLPAAGARVMDLQDPSVKMNKSAPLDGPGVIRVLDPPEVVRRKIARAVTDSGREVIYDANFKPGVANLLEITAACRNSTPERVAAECDTYRDLKTSCTDAVLDVLLPLQARYADLAKDPRHLDQILAHGAHRAQVLAAPTVNRAQSAMGLLPAG
jgi:tryptophanyl-tRNA synthetase